MNIHIADPAIYSLSHLKHIKCGDTVNFWRKAVFRTFVITEKNSVITKCKSCLKCDPSPDSTALFGLEERLQARLRPPKDQSMYVMRPLICIDRLKIGRMTHNLEPLSNSIAPMHVTAHAGNI